jgi:hypothetical protein
MRSLVALSLLLAACALHSARMELEVGPVTSLCVGHEPSAVPCVSPQQIEELLKRAEVHVLKWHAPTHGTAGVVVLWLQLPNQGITLKAKWKRATAGGKAFNNEPRKEVAAYELQKLFLDPDEYVVPPTEARCFPLEQYEREVRRARPTFRHTQCVFGLLAYWMDGVRELQALDRRRFDADPKYRATIANLNLLTFLIDHRDTRSSNFAITDDHDDPRAFSFDNGLAFSGVYNPKNLFRRAWERLVVPRVPHDKIERLRRITRADLDRLATVAEFAIVGTQLQEIPVTASFDDDKGVRIKGNVLQIGLKRSEIDGVEARIRELVHRVDSGTLEEY